MTIKQNIFRLFYPVLIKIGKIFGVNKKILSSKAIAITNFYNLKAVLGNGDDYNFIKLKGKKVLIVNTASNCGYTAQYNDLEKLYNSNKEKLEIIAFPANDFKEQEKDDDLKIAAFCKINFSVSFSIMKKCIVVKSKNQNIVYDWLTNIEKNGWNNQTPTWNFCKYLIDEKGNLTHFFEAPVSPLSNEIISAIEQ
ncbi:MAG: glutathione peroxidase [Ferruginibacter sp.]|nr:glutathione peroxidase [Ferruginibacter sp.]